MTGMVRIGTALDELLAEMGAPEPAEKCEALLPDGQCANDVEWIFSCPHGGEPVLACDWHMCRWTENRTLRWGTCKGCGWQGYLDEMVSAHWTTTLWRDS